MCKSGTRKVIFPSVTIYKTKNIQFNLSSQIERAHDKKKLMYFHQQGIEGLSTVQG